MAERQEFVLGAVVKLTEQEPGQYVAEQTGENTLQPPSAGRGRLEIDSGIGPVRIKGWLDTDDLGIGLSITILGINIGTLYGNLKDGVGTKIDLYLVQGAIKLYLKNGNEFWVRLDLDVKFDGGYHDDHKIIAW